MLAISTSNVFFRFSQLTLDELGVAEMGFNLGRRHTLFLTQRMLRKRGIRILVVGLFIFLV